MDSFGNEGEQGVFNQALAYLARLDHILKELDAASTNNDHSRKYRLLSVFFKELYPMMNEKDRQMHLAYVEEAKKSYKLLQEAIRSKKKTINTEVVELFDIWEIELRDTMHGKGLLMPKQSDPRFALGGGR